MVQSRWSQPSPLERPVGEARASTTPRGSLPWMHSSARRAVSLKPSIGTPRGLTIRAVCYCVPLLSRRVLSQSPERRRDLAGDAGLRRIPPRRTTDSSDRSDRRTRTHERHPRARRRSTRRAGSFPFRQAQGRAGRLGESAPAPRPRRRARRGHRRRPPARRPYALRGASSRGMRRDGSTFAARRPACILEATGAPARPSRPCLLG
jgi:hypothetical protein